MMSTYWPNGLELSDTQSPMEILREAREEWATKGDGVLELVMQETDTKSGNELIIVHAKHVPRNRTATLFTVVHRPNTPYPATIEPKDAELPNFLKKVYYRPGIADGGLGRTVLQGRNIENEWVSESPGEFRAKLEKVFNLGIVKSEILNLVSSSSPVVDDDDREPPDVQTEEE